MIISLVVAASDNNVIGVKGHLPWKLPNDLKHFRTLTEGHTVIMGRKTFESIGHPLPNRQNIVISRQEGWKAEGCTVVKSFPEALESARPFTLPPNGKEVFVIGGGQIYGQALPFADRLYLTRVHAEVEGDAFFFFPPTSPLGAASEWKEVSRETHEADEKNPHMYTFLVYERQK